MDSPSQIRIVQENAKILRNRLRNLTDNTDNGCYGAIQAIYYAKVTLRTYKKYGIKHLISEFSRNHESIIRGAARDLISKIRDMKQPGKGYQFNYEPQEYTPTKISDNSDNSDKALISDIPKEIVVEHRDLLTRMRMDPALAEMFNLQRIDSDKDVISDKNSEVLTKTIQEEPKPKIISLPLPEVVITAAPQKDHNDNNLDISDKSRLLPEPRLLSPTELKLNSPQDPKPLDFLSPNQSGPNSHKNDKKKRGIGQSKASKSKRSGQKKSKVTKKPSAEEKRPNPEKQSSKKLKPPKVPMLLGPESPNEPTNPQPLEAKPVAGPKAQSPKEPETAQIQAEKPPRKRSPFNFANGRVRPHPSAPATVTPVKPESPKRIRPYYPPKPETDKSRPKKPAYQKTADEEIIVTDKIFIREDGVIVNSIENEQKTDKKMGDKDSELEKPSDKNTTDKDSGPKKRSDKKAVISDKNKADLKRIMDLSDDDSVIDELISDRKKKKEEPVKIDYQPTQSPLQNHKFDVLKLHDVLPYDYETVRPYLITMETQDLKNFMDRNPKIADTIDGLFKRRCQTDCPEMLSHFWLLKSWRELHDYYLINYAF